jgi:YD repeat-containing protein
VASITDPLAETTRFGYDGAGRPITQTLPDGNVITETHDANGNLTSLTPPGDPAHRFAYTALDQMQTYTPPDLGSGPTATGYSYNTDGQPTNVTQPDGSQIALAYDGAGRLQAVTIPRGTTRAAYDSANRLSTVTAPDGGTTSYGYDGDLLTGITAKGSVTGTVGYAYNANLQVTSESVGGAGTVTYQYDRDGLPTSVGALSLAYDPQNGLPISSRIGAITDTLSYNGYGEETAYGAANGAASLLGDTYARDDLGRITALTETVGGATHTYGYTYDSVGRLTGVTKDGNLVAQYGYDANGNRTSETTPAGTTSATYDAQDRLQQYGTTAYTYMASGMLQSATNTATGATRISPGQIGRNIAVAYGDASNSLWDAASLKVSLGVTVGVNVAETWAEDAAASP